MSCQSKVFRQTGSSPQMKANEMIQSQVEGRAFCSGFPNVFSGILVRSSLGPRALEVGSYIPFIRMVLLSSVLHVREPRKSSFKETCYRNCATR